MDGYPSPNITYMKRKTILNLAITAICIFLMASCQREEAAIMYGTERTTDSLINEFLHLHQAKHIEVVVIDSCGNLLAHRIGENDRGEYNIESARTERIMPGPLLIPIILLACKEHCGAASIGTTISDNLCPESVIDICQGCFPTMEDLSLAITSHLPGATIEEDSDYEKLCLGQAWVSVPITAFIGLANQHCGGIEHEMSFAAISTDNYYIEEYSIVCREKYCIIIFCKDVLFPGAQKLGLEIANTLQRDDEKRG